MNKIASKRGSALLVVLGMLAFMVVSAVAFSAYMRSSRLPSSYLRRVVSSRMLAKAALAEAIDEIDAAVGNFPHPGVWMRRNSNGTGMSQSENKQSKLTRTTPVGSSFDESRTYQGHNSNAWLGRVYIGGTDDVDSPQARVANIPQNETVSTLSLEALAYIPPPLVNEARYYSRHSNAGKWHQMSFDAGRYAFCAIDVSDYFDINVMSASEPRSSDSAGRMSLAYLFEDVNHDSAGSAADGWDNFISQQQAQNVPLTSLADWNLAMQSSTYGDIKSYFYQYITANGGKFYGSDGETDESADKIRRMTFVTDGWFPQEDATTSTSGGSSSVKTIDLSEQANDLFNEDDLKSVFLYDQVIDRRNNGIDFFKRIPEISYAAMWDYLDLDDIPTSLAIPTVERVPMFCGLRLEGGQDVGISRQDPTDSDVSVVRSDANGNPIERTFVRTVCYTLDAGGLSELSLNAEALYPFRHNFSSKAFDIEARMAVFFVNESSGKMGLRPGNVVDTLKFYKNPTMKSGEEIKNDGVFLTQLTCSPSSWTPPNDIAKPDDAFPNSPFAITVNSVNGLMDANDPFLKLQYTITQTRDVNPETGTLGAWKPEYEPDDKKMPEVQQGVELTFARCGMPALSPNGSLDDSFDYSGNVSKSDGKLLNLLKEGKSVDMNLKVAFWLRFLDSNKKTVDLIPASPLDDNVNGGVEDSILIGELGNGTPILKFDTGVTFKMSLADIGNSKGSVVPSPGVIMIEDPRYNFAPENWFSTANLDRNTIIASAYGTPSDVNKRRDGDIFMSVSDQGCFQSIYELANIPRVRKRGFVTAGNTADVKGDLVNPDVWAHKGDGTYTSSADQTLHYDFMWRTYDPFMRYENDDVTFEDLGIVNFGSGFKVNPYSDSTNVMMAAFANTPLDWRCASPNYEVSGSVASQGLKAGAFNQKYAWNNYNTEQSGGIIDWENLELVAREFMTKMRNANGDDWEDVWREDLDWFDETKTGDEAPKYLLGEQLLENSDQGRLYNCDKQFLYGFWHDCFAVRQQLFLIFVRAEPLLMGGGAIHQSPPQLGTRAVALVWRDPINRSTLDTSTAQPHRTRVLFYRQFD